MSRHVDTTTSATTHIPPFAKPLAPYLKSRQEVLRIRQALTLYLRSHIVFADDDPTKSYSRGSSHVSLCVPTDAAVGVKRIPPELTGVRKEYLKALQENIAARKEYDDIANEVASRRLMNETASETNVAASEGLENNATAAVLQDYISLLRERRRYEKLQVFDHYLRKLNEHDAKKADVIQTGDRNNIGQDSFDGLLKQDGPETEKTAENVQELISKLERTVIRAKQKLDRELKMLEQLKAQRQSSNTTDNNDTSPARRVAALQRTRDELVQWVEEKLAASNGDEDGQFQELSLTEIENSSKLIEERKAEIKEQYAAYVKARKSLLDALSLTSQSAVKDVGAEVESPSKPTSKTKQKALSSNWDSIDSFAYANEILHPLSKIQKSLALQRSYLSGLLTKEQTTMRQALDRLSHESHLLPEYPILARQSRFQHITSSAGSRPDRSGPTKTEEIVEQAQAWAFASEAARSNVIDYVEQKIERGREMAESASETLQQVYELLNQDYKEVMKDGNDEEQNDGDIWAAEVRSSRFRGRQHRDDKRPKGPWSGLNGKVGITGDM
ncbi:hypothetical protein VTN77DRAFT_4910 [Rasamsonia byssochlamydoides]|uniref:uncharacterized protein n=1 Tax=Rasamsonia byssochlamydoides TaxID=89139 RepID=UPI003743F8ED